MKRNSISAMILFSVVGLLLFSVGVTFTQDFEGVIEMVTYTTSGDMSKISNQEKNTIYFKQNMMRVDQPQENNTTIIRLDKELLWDIDHDNKTYTEVSFQQMREGLQSAQKAMREAMKNMTPEQRQMMEKMGMKMPGMPAQKQYKLKKTGKKDKINGYHCEQYLLIKGDESETEELWFTTDLGGFQNISKMMAKMYEGLSGGMTDGLDKLAKVQGIPVKTVERDGDEIEVTEVTKVNRTDVNKTRFKAPANYKKREMAEMPFGKHK
ncbi:MAG: DUF4412 domain-containing protein [bacterium]